MHIISKTKQHQEQPFSRHNKHSKQHVPLHVRTFYSTRVINLNWNGVYARGTFVYGRTVDCVASSERISSIDIVVVDSVIWSFKWFFLLPLFARTTQFLYYSLFFTFFRWHSPHTPQVVYWFHWSISRAQTVHFTSIDTDLNYVDFTHGDLVHFGTSTYISDILSYFASQCNHFISTNSRTTTTFHWHCWLVDAIEGEKWNFVLFFFCSFFLWTLAPVK